MAIQAHICSRMMLGGGCQDFLTENVYGSNNICLNLHHQELMHRIPKIIDDHHSISQIISSQIDNQRIEIDHYINSQNERLRMALQEQRKQQTSALMKKYESKVESLIRHKDEEILKAAHRNMELQDCVRKMEMERQRWERAAQENEEAAASLKSRIQGLRESAAEDAESWCGGETWGQETRKMMVCRCCNNRESCVIMLPCRHLCSCSVCDAFLDSCPVCNVAKNASLQALL